MDSYFCISKVVFERLIDEKPIHFLKIYRSESMAFKILEVVVANIESHESGIIFRCSGKGAHESLCFPYGQIKFLYIDLEVNPGARTLVIVLL